MNSFKALLTVLLFLISFHVTAKVVTDTLYSAENDCVIVTYRITQKDNVVDVQFRSVRILLGDFHHDKYEKEIDKVHTLFFDCIGCSKDMKFTGETPSLVCLPVNASYKRSNDGFFIIEQRPTLSFELGASGSDSLTIPIYLAHYERKGRYKILCSCGDLKVRISHTSTSSSNAQPAIKKPSLQSSDEFVEIGEGIDENDTEALNLIRLIKVELPRQDAYPMESTLVKKIDRLNELQAKIKKEEIVKDISKTLEDCNNKERELRYAKEESDRQKADDDDFTNCTTKEDFQRYLNKHPEGSHVDEANAKINNINNDDKKIKDKERKRNIWMIIGGALLAILLFVGNQVMQSFRNIRTQRSMMQMQQDAAKRAQNMARGKVQNEIRKQTNKVTGQVRKKSQTIIRDTTKKAKNNKGNSRVSI